MRWPDAGDEIGICSHAKVPESEQVRADVPREGDGSGIVGEVAGDDQVCHGTMTARVPRTTKM